jgi:hypothetical protein
MAFAGVVNFAAGVGTLEDSANARLIAAAPDLLAALNALLWQHDNNGGQLCGMALQDARAALAKAGHHLVVANLLHNRTTELYLVSPGDDGALITITAPAEGGDIERPLIEAVAARHAAFCCTVFP